MCGLFAGTGKVNPRTLTALGCLNESRGDDSAGIAWHAENETRYLKIAQNPLVAFPVTLQGAIRNAARKSAPLIGHTRQATQGKVTSENAHPFLDAESQIAWAHNGVISNDDKFGKFAVDSECLIGGIKARNFSEYVGSIALVWLEEGKLHAYRKGNPLFRGRMGRATYLASERRMLEAVGCTAIKEIAEGRIYRFNEHQIDDVRVVPTNSVTGYTGSTSKFQGHGAWEEGCVTNYYRCKCGGHYSQWACERAAADEKAETENKTLVQVSDGQGGRALVSLDEYMDKNKAALTVIQGGIEIVDEEKAKPSSVMLCDACGKNSHTPASAYCAECMECFGIAH